MHLSDIRLINFKNYTDQKAEFIPGINCIVGENGGGKTNLLDAIHYLSLTRSAFNSTDSQNIRNGESFFTIIGRLGRPKTGKTHDQVFCNLQKGSKKVFKWNDQEYEKLSMHLGRFPSVIIAPNDTDLVRESNEIRRKFFDSLLSQTDMKYLESLISYNHNLKQRTHLLRLFHHQAQVDYDLLEPYNKALLKHGKLIYNRRQKAMKSFLKEFEVIYSDLVDGKETAGIKYNSQFQSQNYLKDFENSISTDIENQRSNFGIHKDGWAFEVNQKALKRFGSQGQQKSFVIALRLTVFTLLRKLLNQDPLLMLDDIFDKLDDSRIRNLMQMITKDGFDTQIFITDPRPERAQTILESLNLEAKTFFIQNGEIEIH